MSDNNKMQYTILKAALGGPLENSRKQDFRLALNTVVDMEKAVLKAMY